MGRAKEILRAQAVYEQIMSSAAEKREGRGIAVRWALSLNQEDSSHIGIPEGLTISGGSDEKAPLLWLSGPAVRYHGLASLSGLEFSGRAGFPQKGGENLELEYFLACQK